MRIHHISCATMCPYGNRLMSGAGGWLEPGQVCCHCLLIESKEGLVLVDTGLSAGDLEHPRNLPLELRLALRPQPDPSQSALHQIRALGYTAKDVKHIVLTHLDFDHAGGLEDFPQAQVHVYGEEHRAALHPPTFFEKRRYLQQNWRHKPKWVLHNDDAGEGWNGFGAVRALHNQETEILLVPVKGHTRGHCAVAVREQQGWLLHCGDAYFYRGEMDSPPHAPIGIKAFQTLLAHDNDLRLENQDRLRQLKQQADGSIRLFCAHDPVELQAMQ